MTIAEKNIGYELRCADPVPFDVEYTRDLGYCAAKYLLSGGNAAMVSMQLGRFVPMPFARCSTRHRSRVCAAWTCRPCGAPSRRFMIRCAATTSPIPWRREDRRGSEPLGQSARSFYVTEDECAVVLGGERGAIQDVLHVDSVGSVERLLLFVFNQTALHTSYTAYM